jgi:hypothetical protein
MFAKVEKIFSFPWNQINWFVVFPSVNQLL